MASAMAMMKHFETGHGLHGVGGLALDSAVGFGTSYAIGQLYHRHGDKWYGAHAPKIAAVVGKVGGVVLSFLAGGEPTIFGGMVDAVGQAGLNAYGLELGLEHARKATGKIPVLLPKGTDIKAIKGAEQITRIGDLGKASPGKGLDWNSIEDLAAGR